MTGRLVFDERTISYLQARLEDADSGADVAATRGGELRAIAAEHIAQANQCDEDAVSARTEADRLRELLAFAREHSNSRPGDEPPAPAATDQLVARRPPYTPYPGDTAVMRAVPQDACQTFALPRHAEEAPDASAH